MSQTVSGLSRLHRGNVVGSRVQAELSKEESDQRNPGEAETHGVFVIWIRSVSVMSASLSSPGAAGEGGAWGLPSCRFGWALKRSPKTHVLMFWSPLWQWS